MQITQGWIARCAQVFGCMLALTAGHAAAQALPTAVRPMSLQGYGGVTYAKLDYVGAPSGSGFMLGGVSRVHTFSMFDLGLDVRGTSATSPTVDQRTVTGGLRATFSFGPLQPYFAYGGGGGLITFPKHNDPNYTSDHAFITAAVGGIDLQVAGHWSVMVDVDRQSWKLGSASTAFQPLLTSAGVRYRIGSVSGERSSSRSSREY